MRFLEDAPQQLPFLLLLRFDCGTMIRNPFSCTKPLISSARKAAFLIGRRSREQQITLGVFSLI